MTSVVIQTENRIDVCVIDGDRVSRWWIEGDQFVRVLVEPGYGESASAVGHTYRRRFTRTRAGELIFKGGGSAQKLVRCRDVPPEWEYRPGR